MAAALLAAAPAAQAVCGTVVSDFEPGAHALHCSFGPGAEEEWVVPEGITRPLLTVRGSDSATARGGLIAAKLKVTAGETLRLVMGQGGAASSVLRGSTALLTAGGGSEGANFAAEGAEVVESEAPGGPVGKFALDGEVWVEWYDAREPMDTSKPRPQVIVDIFDSQKAGFGPTGGWRSWTVPPGVSSATFELFGGPGGSGGARGHVLAGLRVQPGETFGFRVGGPGADTTVVRSGAFERIMAAGGDTERPNYILADASPELEFWEGGGPGSVPANGHLTIHYWPPSIVAPLAPGVSPTPPPAPRCVVPNLRSKTRAGARRALRRAGCALGRVRRRESNAGNRGRVVGQRPPVGTTSARPRTVTIILGSR